MSEKNFEYRITRREITKPSQIFQSDGWLENNQILISGKIKEEFEKSQLNDEYYQSTVAIRRYSGVCDYIIILISEELKNSLTEEFENQVDNMEDNESEN